MPADDASGRLDAKSRRAVRTVNEPDIHLARAVWQRAIDGRGHSHGVAELADGLFRGGADGDDAGHRLESRCVNCLDMDGDQNNSRQVLRNKRDGLAALCGQEVMSFVEDGPMSAYGFCTKLLQFGKERAGE